MPYGGHSRFDYDPYSEYGRTQAKLGQLSGGVGDIVQSFMQNKSVEQATAKDRAMKNLEHAVDAVSSNRIPWDHPTIERALSRAEKYDPDRVAMVREAMSPEGKPLSKERVMREYNRYQEANPDKKALPNYYGFMKDKSSAYPGLLAAAAEDMNIDLPETQAQHMEGREAKILDMAKDLPTEMRPAFYKAMRVEGWEKIEEASGAAHDERLRRLKEQQEQKAAIDLKLAKDKEVEVALLRKAADDPEKLAEDWDTFLNDHIDDTYNFLKTERERYDKAVTEARKDAANLDTEGRFVNPLGDGPVLQSREEIRKDINRDPERTAQLRGLWKQSRELKENPELMTESLIRGLAEAGINDPERLKAILAELEQARAGGYFDAAAQKVADKLKALKGQ